MSNKEKYLVHLHWANDLSFKEIGKLLGENIIDDQSMKKSCQLALMQYTLFDDSANLQQPNYSNKFRNKLKDIKAAQKPINIIMLIAKRIAIIALVCIISFSTAIVANAEFRNKFFNWTVKKFPQFSIFNSQDTEEMANDFDVLKSLAITYIPDSFKLFKTLTGKSMIVYEYSNNHNQTISITLATTISFYKDTEGATINQFAFKDNVAYWWQANGFTYLVWQQDDIQCSIIAELSIEEVLKIANSIIK